MPDIVGGFVGGVFLFAGVSKLTVLRRFAESLQWIPVLGGHGAQLAPAVVGVELAIGTSLLLGMARGPMQLAGLFVLLASSAVLSIGLVGHLQAECMCFGQTPQKVTPRTVIRNLGLAALLGGALTVGSNKPPDPYGTLIGVSVLMMVLLFTALRSVSESLRGGT
jgi:hypothetical protein